MPASGTAKRTPPTGGPSQRADSLRISGMRPGKMLLKQNGSSLPADEEAHRQRQAHCSSCPPFTFHSRASYRLHPRTMLVLNPAVFALQLFFIIGLYGSGVLLVHEAAVRCGKAWERSFCLAGHTGSWRRVRECTHSSRLPAVQRA